MQETLDALPGAIGARIKLTTTTSSTHEGTLFTYCPLLKIIALNTSPAPPNPASNPLATNPADYALFPVTQISNLTVLSLPTSASVDVDKRSNGTTSGNGHGSAQDVVSVTALQPEIRKVDTARLKAREQERVRKLKEIESKRGRDVSSEAQSLFNALDRMYETRWHNQEIIVADAVIVGPPYTAEACKAPKEKAQVLAQIRKVVEGERRKIAERARTGASGAGGSGGSEGTSPAPGQRKGG